MLFLATKQATVCMYVNLDSREEAQGYLGVISAEVVFETKKSNQEEMVSEG
jgi:hypothetical protein